MKNKLITTTVLTMAVFLTGVFIVQAQTNVSVEAEQRTEVRSDSETDDADDEQEQEEANYNNSRSNRSTIRDDGDADGDGYGDVERSNQADTQANSTTSADIDANDEDDDGDAVSDGITKEIDKASPKLMEALSIGEDSPLRNAGVEISVRGDVCSADEDCDDDGVATAPSRANISLRVSGSEVRGWDAEQKEAIRTRLQAATEMTTANDFGLRVASAALDNEDVLDITTDDQATEVRYQTRLRLLGFIPVPATAVARAEADGEVAVDYPWYSFLAQKGDESIFSQLAADLRADHDVMISVEEEGVKRTVRDEADEEN